MSQNEVAATEGFDKTKLKRITVKLTGEDGNVFNLIALCRQAMIRAGIDKAQRDAFINECFKMQSYDDVIHFMAETFNVK